MAMTLQKLWTGYWYIEEHYTHPYTRKWFMISNPLPLATILAAYLYFCLHLGPRLMKNRQPFELRNVMMVYNLVQIFWSSYMFYKGATLAWLSHYKFYCQPITFTDDPVELEITSIVYLYFLNKLSDLLDTVFFVLRKKDVQITSLHLYHHTLMPFSSWFGVKFTPNGHLTLLGWLNCLVHVIMYGYYFVSALGPQYQKYLWWKKHLTLLQLVQFAIIFWQNVAVLFMDCGLPRAFIFLTMTQSLVFIYMFGMFYYKSYLQKRKKM